MLPHDYKDFWEETNNQKQPRTFIVKPEDSCQGKGIYLTRTPNDIKPNDQLVVQKYMHKPHLIDGFKYDLRVYVFVNGINPLRIYVYKDGLARFATEQYQKPSDKNIDNLFMHLTNYAINKESENFIQNTDKNNDDIGIKMAMHIAASNPLAIDKSKIEKAIVDKELEIIKAEIINSGKPAEMVEKISKGKILKFLNDNSLLNQLWIMDQKKKVSDILKEYSSDNPIQIVDFIRYKVGEGI